MAKEYDPRMHSAEHLLNRTMDRMFACGRSVNTHLERKKSKCDYPLGRDLRPEEVREIERVINGFVAADLPVREEFLPREKAAAAFNLSRLPGEAGDSIRIIRIGDYDACPCIGSHVASTAMIGEFRIVSTGWSDGILRVRFRLAPPQG